MVGDGRRSSAIKSHKTKKFVSRDHSDIIADHRRASPIIADIWELSWMIPGNKLICLLRFDRRWSPTISDIIHRRSHISQTSRPRRKALIAVVHHRYMRTRLKNNIGVFQFPFWKTQDKGICFLLDAWQQCDLCSMICTLQKWPRRCCAILLRNGNLYGWNLYSFCLQVKKLNPKHFFF